MLAIRHNGNAKNDPTETFGMSAFRSPRRLAFDWDCNDEMDEA